MSITTAADTLALLDAWAERGWLRVLDAAFARFLWREASDAPPLLILAAALASHQLGRGHVCLDLAATLADPAFALSLPPEGGARGLAVELPGTVLHGVDLEQWQAALVHPLLVAPGPGDTPLVVSGQRVYLRRYWQYERDVARGIASRLGTAAALPPEVLRTTLEVLFPAPADAPVAPDWQKLGCALAARSAFSIITGGPGTGKTTTVVRLLALLQALAAGDGGQARLLRIRLAAPTGKAAARLNESIAGAVAKLPLAGLAHGEAIRAAIPVKVTTLHRLLGSRPDTRRFRHGATHPLALDVLVIDEASMIDLEMMAAVLAALPPHARLVLLGDKDQLASVEAGAVLGTLCRRAAEGHYDLTTRDWLAQVTGTMLDATLVDEHGAALDQAVAMLRHSHRFGADSGIGKLAAAVNSGDYAAVAQVWRAAHDDLACLPAASLDETDLAALLIDGGASPAVASAGRVGYRHYLDTLRARRPAQDGDTTAFDDWARAVLVAHAGFQVLCALRAGPWGVAGLNERIARVLHKAQLVPATEGWYEGRPVLVTRNDHGLGLMNGDIGIALELPADTASGRILRVAFPSGDGAGGIKWVLPSRLQAVDTVYALTVHKSQGSEFSHAALVLPDTPSPILTRELYYTGITRARHWFTLVNPGGAGVERIAVQRRVLRSSGNAA
jgi:exodeoxyribonuclease V alpha subunit